MCHFKSKAPTKIYIVIGDINDDTHSNTANFIKRRNKIAQAVSLAKAAQTQQFMAGQKIQNEPVYNYYQNVKLKMGDNLHAKQRILNIVNLFKGIRNECFFNSGNKN